MRSSPNRPCLQSAPPGSPCTLFTKMNERLKPRLLKELKPGARVVAYQFNGMGDWKPRQVDTSHPYPVFFWVVPERR